MPKLTYPDLPVFYTLREIAKAGSLSTSFVHRAIHAGHLAPGAITASGRWIFSKESVRTYLESLGVDID